MVDEKEWQRVYDARLSIYQEVFGEFPGEVFGSQNFQPGAWPGGCLAQIKDKNGHGWFSSTVGLTNPGILESSLSNPLGFPQSNSVAGYGYEIVVCTRGVERWPVEVLFRIVRVLFSPGFDYLGEIDRFGGSFVWNKFLLVPGFNRLPKSAEIPNGNFRFLALLHLTPEELAFLYERPMKESLPDFLASKSDEWIDPAYKWVPPATQ